MSVHILAENFLDPDIFSNRFVSSEQAAFPVDNVLNKVRRSKIYRSNGYWEITASNNILIFQETTAVNLTATIAVGNYTSSATLFAAIKSALELTGDSTYTVTAATLSGKVQIVSNGFGGGGIFSLMTSNVGSTMASLLGFNILVDYTGSLTVLADLLRVSTGEWIKFDFGISTNLEAFVLIGARNSPIKISPGAVIKLQASETDAWTTPSYQTTVTYHDQAMFLTQIGGLHTEALRYWRLSIQDLDNPLGYIEIGSIYLGNIFQPSIGDVNFPLDSNLKDNSNTVISEGGQTLSDIREKTQEFTLLWQYIRKEDAEFFGKMFNDFGKSFPFFLIMDPNSFFNSSENLSIRYVKFKEEPVLSLIRPDLFSFQAIVREEL